MIYTRMTKATCADLVKDLEVDPKNPFILWKSLVWTFWLWLIRSSLRLLSKVPANDLYQFPF